MRAGADEFQVPDSVYAYERELSHQAWARFGARLFDGLVINFITLLAIFVVFILAAIIDGMFALGWLAAYETWAESSGRVVDSTVEFVLATVATVLVWLLIEPMLLAGWGQTPGKWLFGIRVRDAEGRKLKYTAALSRTARVLVFGMAFGIPLLSLIAAVVAKSALETEGVTGWDKKLNLTVQHRKSSLLIWSTVLPGVMAINLALNVFERLAN